MMPTPRPLKLYVDRSDFPPDGTQVPILRPFWGDRLMGQFRLELDDAHDLETIGTELFELTSLADCDLALYPAYWKSGAANEEAHRLAARAKQAGKKTLIFFWHDSDEFIPLENAIIYRTSLTRSGRRPGERVLPVLVKDWGAEAGGRPINLREFNPRPVIGYCGYVVKRKTPLHDLIHAAGASIPVDRALARMGVRLIKAPAVRLRTQAVRLLERSSVCATNFLLRDTGFDGAAQPTAADTTWARQSRSEFFDNILDSDYTLCVRGAGNFSLRFYQTLMCGRIPLFVDTDSLLPDEDTIPWDDYIVRVPEADLGSLPQRLLAWHGRLTPELFQQRQQGCRRLWEERFSAPGFFRGLSRQLRKELSPPGAGED
jgi:hypothetical protein